MPGNLNSRSKIKGTYMVWLWWISRVFVVFIVRSNKQHLNSLSAKFTKWSNTLKQFVGKLPRNCLSVFDHFVNLALKGLISTFAVSLYFCSKNEERALFESLKAEFNEKLKTVEEERLSSEIYSGKFNLLNFELFQCLRIWLLYFWQELPLY